MEINDECDDHLELDDCTSRTVIKKIVNYCNQMSILQELLAREQNLLTFSNHKRPHIPHV